MQRYFVTHLEGVNHNSVTREMVRRRAKVAGFLDRVFIPEDGEMVEDLLRIKEEIWQKHSLERKRCVAS